MSDLVESLRDVSLFSKKDWQEDVALCRQAADEIERLRGIEKAARGMHCNQVGTRWRHIKTGGEYEIVGHCLIEATVTSAFLYRNLKTGEVWARPKDEFLDGRFAALTAEGEG